MFSFYIAFIIFITQILFVGLSWEMALIPFAKFIFYWNGIFAFLTLLFFVGLLLGLSAILFKLPVIGVGIYRFNESIRKTGILSFLGERFLFWFLSKTFILVGSYFIFVDPTLPLELLLTCLTLVILGYAIKSISENRRKKESRSQINMSIFQSEIPIEKEINPESINKNSKTLN